MFPSHDQQKRELDLLSATIASLRLDQSDAQLKTNLETIKNSYQRLKDINDENVSAAEYKRRYPNSSKSEIEELKTMRGEQQEAAAQNMGVKELVESVTGETVGINITSDNVWSHVGI